MKQDLFLEEARLGPRNPILIEHDEAPRLARSAETALKPGHVVTVEPGVYVPGVGGVRIEDLVVVTESGRDVLSHTSKELLTVD